MAIDDGDMLAPKPQKTAYTVGYRKPPKHSQFTKGQSGNPKGRPKGAKSFATEFHDELSTRIHVTENGKPKKISRRKAVTKQLINRAAAGDLKAILLLLNEVRLQESLLAPGMAQPTAPPSLIINFVDKKKGEGNDND